MGKLQCDLLDLPAVAQLEKDAKYAPVYQLLKIFLTQRLNAYKEFQNANSDFLQSYGTITLIHLLLLLKHDGLMNRLVFVGLIDEDCVTKMRLLSLVDLASDESGKIPYASIRDALQVKTLFCLHNT